MIPIVNMTPFLESTDREQKLSVAKTIRQACETYGFFQIINHGVSHDIIDKMTDASFHFFRLPNEEKLKLAARRWNPLSSNEYCGYFPSEVNGKEGLDLSNPHMSPTHPFVHDNVPLHELNQWPIEKLGDQWRTTVTQYWDSIWQLSLSIMHAIAMAFDLNENYFDKLIDDTSDGGAGTLSILRLNYYPKGDQSMIKLIGDDGAPLSCETHFDNVLITILYQHQVDGLQVQVSDTTKRWLDVEVVPYAFIINTGKCLERLTNGILKAINHRVRLIDKERLSIPFFLGACYTTPLALLPTSISEENPAKFETINYGPYIMEAMKIFKEYRRKENDD